MPFVQVKCPICGGILAVDDTKKQRFVSFAAMLLLSRKQYITI